MAVAPTTYGAVTDEVIAELTSLLGEENVLTDLHERAMRAFNCAPAPLHRWADQTPDVVVLPGGTDDVVAILKLADERRIPVTPRGGASGLADGAMPLRKGICVDIKRMNEVFEIDEENSCVTVGTGINPLKLNEILEPLGKFFPDDLAGYANAVIGGRIGCGGWTLIGGRYGHIPDTVISMECVLPERRGDLGRRRRHQEGAQELLRVPPQGPLHAAPGHAVHRHPGRPRALPQARGRVRRLLRLRQLGRLLRRPLRRHHQGLRHHLLGDDLRRPQDRLPAPRRRGLHPAATRT